MHRVVLAHEADAVVGASRRSPGYRSEVAGQLDYEPAAEYWRRHQPQRGHGPIGHSEPTAIMRVDDVDLGRVLNAAGARNFFGDGYPYHGWWRYLGLTFAGATFVTKTTTLAARVGNMALRPGTTTPLEYFPRCIIAKPLKGVVLNAVGLSGPGAAWLLEQGVWQAWPEPFVLSFMALGDTRDQQCRELADFVALLKAETFRHRPVLELNVSCPNVNHHDPRETYAYTTALLDTLRAYGWVALVKIGLGLTPQAARSLDAHPACAGLVVGNTVPWGWFPDRIDWPGLFGTTVSPLAHLGGGGLSGWPLLPLVVDWIVAARGLGFRKPICACGGIMSRRAVRLAAEAGASAVEVGTVAMLRPWRLRGIIKYAVGYGYWHETHTTAA